MKSLSNNLHAKRFAEWNSRQSATMQKKRQKTDIARVSDHFLQKHEVQKYHPSHPIQQEFELNLALMHCKGMRPITMVKCPWYK
jgi:hypothetical protein